MTSSQPPLFDDGGALPETRVRDEHGQHDGRQPREPNYLVRRAVAIGVVIAALVGGSVVAAQIIGARGDGESDSPSTAPWNAVVLVADDEVRVIDPATGTVTDTYPGDEPLLDVVSVVAGKTIVFLNDLGRITQLDLTDGSIRRSSGQEDGTMSASDDHAAIVLAGLPAGGDVTVVDTETRTTFDIGDIAALNDALMFVDEVLVNRSGTHVATPDARSFQSVLVDIATETPVLLAGQVVALDDDTVVTAQRAGPRAELEFYDLSGERLGSADAPSPQVTMLLDGARVLVVAADGAVVGVDADGTVDDLGTVAPSTTGGDTQPVLVRSGFPVPDLERLVVATDDAVVLLGTDGAEVARFTGELLSRVGSGSRCALIGSARANSVAVHVDLTTGEALGEVAGGSISSASVDGCTVSMIGSPRLVVRGTEAELGATSGSITVAPDGTAYVLTTSTQNQLISLANEDDEPIDLADDTVVVRFAEI